MAVEIISLVFAILGTVGMIVKAVGTRKLKLTKLPDGVESFVLYLRPFRPERRHYVNLMESEEDFQRRLRSGRIALDEFLAREAAARIGPVVGLGRPGDRDARPGAYRIYLDDEADWRAELGRLADRATAIVMIPGYTASLAWEMQYICEKRLWSKLFVVTRRPVGSAVPASWVGFARDLTDAGLGVDEEDPGPDVVVGFSPEGASRVVGTAATPAELVDAIEGWVPGRWTGDASVPAPVDARPVAEATPALPDRDPQQASGAPSPARDRTSVAVTRPMHPFDRWDLPIVALAGVPVIAWMVTAAVRDGGAGSIVGAAFTVLFLGPFVVIFVVALAGYLRVPDVDAMARRGDVRGLVRALWHRTPAVRERAVDALGRRTDVQTAITVLGSADRTNLVEAIQAAARVIDTVGDAAVEPLAEAMDGGSGMTHLAYVGALAGHQERFLAVLVAALRAESVSTRTVASATVRERLADEALPADVREATTTRLVAMLGHEPDYRVRRAAVDALSGNGSEQVVAALTDAAQTDADDKVRADAAGALLRVREAGAAPTTGAELSEPET